MLVMDWAGESSIKKRVVVLIVLTVLENFLKKRVLILSFVVPQLENVLCANVCLYFCAAPLLPMIGQSFYSDKN